MHVKTAVAAAALHKSTDRRAGSWFSKNRNLRNYGTFGISIAQLKRIRKRETACLRSLRTSPTSLSPQRLGRTAQTRTRRRKRQL